MSRSPVDPDEGVKADVRRELEAMRIEFHDLLESLSPQDLRRRSDNPGWTNGEILFHMTFALILLRSLDPMVRLWGRLPSWCSRGFAASLDLGTPIFNWFNGFGARAGARIYSGERLGRRYDGAHRSVMRMLEHVRDDEWAAGMHCPSKWDSLFAGYMTLEDVFRYPVKHFRFHVGQISR